MGRGDLFAHGIAVSNGAMSNVSRGFLGGRRDLCHSLIGDVGHRRDVPD